jgi:hypothetical protein
LPEHSVEALSIPIGLEVVGGSGLLINAFGGEICLDLLVDVFGSVVTPDCLVPGGPFHVPALVLEAVAYVDEGSSYVILVLEALDGGELGVVVKDSEDIALVVEACDCVGASKIGMKELEYP